MPSLVAILLAASLVAGPPAGRILEGPVPVEEPPREAGPPIAAPLLAWQPAPTPPGGYWSLGERSVPEPPDGHDALTIGSVIFSLGLIRAGAGGVSVYMATRPDLCAANCRSLGVFGWSGVAFGGLMFATGLVLMSVGAAQKAKHQRWQQGLARVRISPWWTATRSTRSLGLSLDLRF
ncbi:hypothetical protein ACNOYE_18655 [Nannocystaceae bacterium ST9]